MLAVMEKIILPGCQPGELEHSIEILLAALGTDVFSHPEKALAQHLRGVFQNGLELARDLGIQLEPRSLMVAALLHDIYKADVRFQAYLAGKGKGVHHAQPSAWFAMLFAHQCGLDFEKSFLAAEVIRRHHTDLMNFPEIEAAWNIEEKKIVSDLSSLARYFPLVSQSSCFRELQDFLFDLSGESDENLWFDLRLLYSVLVAADRMDACGIQYFPVSFPGFSHTISFDGAGRTAGEINAWRAHVQHECFQRALEIITEPGVYSLTLPTGAGKTFAGFNIAHALIEKFGYASLIYALPFISIVEQTTRTATMLYGEDLVQEDHSLRPIESQEDDKCTLKRMADLFRYWHSPVVLTTMVQFWESVFAPQANQSMNFHRLSNAVVILDEPQTIPVKYWAGLGETIQFLSQKLGTIFILMTATQPYILDKKVGRKELAPRKYNFPKNRHQYQVVDLMQSFEMGKVLEIIEENRLVDMGSGLVVLNTRRAAIQAFDMLTNSFLANRFEIRLLSTWLTPRHRKETLARVKRAEEYRKMAPADGIEAREERLPMLLVSTQVVEAGVDLDFDWVFRDFGPLESIIQVGGRCNRHASRSDQGKIFVASLQANGRRFASSVYDKVLLEATRDVLRSFDQFDEDVVAELVARYYQLIEGVKAVKDIFSELREGNWGETRLLFEDRKYDEVAVIVEEDEEVSGLLEEIEGTPRTLVNLDKRKSLMQCLQQYVIQIPRKYISPIQERCSQIFSADDDVIIRQVMGGSFYYLRNNAVGIESIHSYHPVKGFLPPEEADGEAALVY